MIGFKITLYPVDDPEFMTLMSQAGFDSVYLSTINRFYPEARHDSRHGRHASGSAGNPVV
jgi:hypothetical protein